MTRELEPGILDRVSHVALFSGIDPAALAALVGTLKVQTLAAGDTLFREGDAGRALFILLAGELEVLRASPGAFDTRVALHGPGDWVGEMSVIDIMPRSATVRAASTSEVLVLSSQDLDRLYRSDLRSYVMLIQNLARELSRKLRVANAIVARMAGGYFDEINAPPRPRI